ncbi:hypothetical protein KAJ38_00205 [Candidatus Pacearchaeota archaeon]|nr:hypothetical protein [Candidatus Pacearchaeota archaeon]
MPSNAGRGRVKIVEPVDSSKDLELVGGLKNAFERGESFAKAKQSFINAGYKPSAVDNAAQEMRKLLYSTKQQSVTPAETKSTPPIKTTTPKIKQLPKASKISSTKKKEMPKALVILLIIILIAILVGAAVLGLFWDQLI